MFAVASSVNIDEVIKAGTQILQSVRGEYLTIAEQLEARGEARGEAKRNIEIAQNMFVLGLSNEVISQSTGLSIEKVQELRE